MESSKKTCNKCNKSPVKFQNPLILFAIYVFLTSIYGNYILFKKILAFLETIF
jgi:hypothetical protein